MADKRRPTTLYGDYAFAWTMTGIAVVRARSEADAAWKFEGMSRATMLNRPGTAFHSIPIRLPDTGETNDR